MFLGNWSNQNILLDIDDVLPTTLLKYLIAINLFNLLSQFYLHVNIFLQKHLQNKKKINSQKHNLKNHLTYIKMFINGEGQMILQLCFILKSFSAA